jgi:hypothetical protein
MPLVATNVRPKPVDGLAVESEEAKPHQHAFAQAQGKEYARAVTHMAETVAQLGGEVQAGEMIIGLAIEKAEGMYVMRDGELIWEEPGQDNAHLEVSARDATDQRFIPGLEVRVRVLDEAGGVAAQQTLPMLWHPWLYHYGANMALPEKDELTVEIEIEAPAFPRHDEKNGKRFADDVFVSFEGVALEFS